MTHCRAYGCSNRSNKVGCENVSWHKHRFCYMARAATTEHLNMLFGKICVWRYVSPYYLLEFTTFAVDHDPNASLSCAFTWKPLKCRLNCKDSGYNGTHNQVNCGISNYLIFEQDAKTDCHFVKSEAHLPSFLTVFTATAFRAQIQNKFA